jgi:hypothetical protein
MRIVARAQGNQFNTIVIEDAEMILPASVNKTQPDVELPIKAFYIGACPAARPALRRSRARNQNPRGLAEAARGMRRSS